MIIPATLPPIERRIVPPAGDHGYLQVLEALEHEDEIAPEQGEELIRTLALERPEAANAEA